MKQEYQVQLTAHDIFFYVFLPVFAVTTLSSAFVLLSPALQPVWSSILIAMVFVWALKSKNEGLLPIEIGSFYFGFVFLYCTVPFIAFAANDFRFGILSDGRLFRADPSPEEVAHVGYYYISYLLAFSVAYLVVRDKSIVTMQDTHVQRSSTFIIVLLFLILFLLELPIFYLKYNAMAEIPGDTYGEQYLWFNEYPLLWRQLLNRGTAISLTLQLLIVTYLVLSYRKLKWVITIFLLVKLIALILTLGSRKEFALLLIASVICYFNYVKRVTFLKVLVITSAVVFIFLIFGWARAMQYHDFTIERASIFPNTEFEALFANAFDIWVQKTGLGLDPPQLYWMEGIVNLIPQQLFPGDKPSLSNWYVNTYYPHYAESGGGFAFGVIPESIVSKHSWFAISWRGLFHGWLLGWVFNRYYRSRKHPVQIAAYVWVTVFSYQLFRDTTFSLVPKVVFDLFPVVVLALSLSALERWARRDKPQ